jgi:peptidoglycan hydrolase-like protein with peptidoglycan-binding domain
MRTQIRKAAVAVAVVALTVVWLLGQDSTADAARPAPAARQAPAVARLTPDVLRPGMRGAAVKALQQRLAQLHYYPGPRNGHFTRDTLEAVWAFKEVQGISTATQPNQVGSVMRQALADPRQPKALVPHGGKLRIEVNLAKEYLVLYRHGQVALISHISAGGGYYFPCPWGGTCGPAITPDGDYQAQWFAPGWLDVPLGRMYNSVFFIGSDFAIHGDTPIPLRPASHGCVRIPVHVASVLHTQIHVSQSGGTPIYIRGHAPRGSR